jgi:hypothetical protein
LENPQNRVSGAANNATNPLLTGGITEKKSPIPKDFEKGIDWLSFSYSVNTDLVDGYSSLWTVKGTGLAPYPGEPYNEVYTNVPFMKTSLNVNFNSRNYKTYVRFNPSTAKYGKSRELVTASESQEIVAKAIDAISFLVPPEFDVVQENGTITRAHNWKKHVRLQRVDCARNLLIHDPLLFMREVEAQIPKRKRETFTHRPGKTGWGLVNKTKEVGRDQLYHKDAELGLDWANELLTSQEGSCFRFETQLRKDRLEQFGFYTLADVTEENMWNAIEVRWNACRWGITYPEPGMLKETLAHLSFNDQCNVVEYLAIHSLGMESGYTDSRRRRVGKLVQDLGLRAGDPIETQGKGTRYVDIYTGKVENVSPNGTI